MQCMEVKLGTHMYFTVSMTTINKKCPQTLFPVTTSSLLKLAYHTMHKGKTWYACVFQRFHDDYEQKWPQAVFPITLSSLFKLANHTMRENETCYACVFHRFHNNHQQKIASSTFPCNYFFTSQTCMQVYLRVSMMSPSLRHSISIHTIGIFIGACPPLNHLH